MILHENEHGVLVSEHICGTCARTFTVCPAAKTEDDWQDCLAPDCASYDPERDVDLYLEQGGVLAVEPGTGGLRA